uniref:Uncharacterized protein n=1 Tax=Chromera velia CCMP2878 TaxID=1169474 RepID=A0A0G4HCF8_9ALVE|eukprot:Cvel_26194.t1-p1 / transcript=Cvel_26194.t1 / gene=Cvel_26194 / organism=Chromera_velia_CCMP2878 / gene_product=hypothetical protein / transcript_product=hypothetical protein / location=Cvel_scaffold3082:2327-2809(+) / protein_length=161 / sequence_SO=supercontig / SO=protein_coding / is_pseudo=false
MAQDAMISKIAFNAELEHAKQVFSRCSPAVQQALHGYRMRLTEAYSDICEMLEARVEKIFPKSLYVIILDGNQKKHRKYLLIQLFYPLLSKRVYLIVRRLFCQNADITAYIVWTSLVAVGLDEKLGIATLSDHAVNMKAFIDKLFLGGEVVGSAGDRIVIP